MASILDTPTSANAATHTFTVSAANNRALVVGVQTEGTQSGTMTCTYGGQSMTNVVQTLAGSGTTQQTVALFFLNDAGIVAASGTTISAGNTGTTDTTVHAASYQDCIQTTPTNTDTDSSAATTPNPLAALDITTGAVNAVVVALSGMGNTGTATWASPLTERTDQNSGSSAGSMADDEVATATTVACECTWSNQNRAAAVAYELVHQPSDGITSIDSDYGDASDEFDYNENSLDINGTGFEASQGTGTVYISDANTLAGSANEVEIDTAINSWSDILVNLDLTLLSAGQAASLETLGPGARYIIVVNDSSDEYASAVQAAHRAKAIDLSASANIAVSGENTTAQLTAPATKTTGDFGGGRIQDDENPGDTVDIGADEYREDEWSIVANLDSVYDETYEFRVLVNGQPIGTYTVTPQLTIEEVVAVLQTHQMII